MSRKAPEESDEQKREREAAIADWRAVMSTPAGRRFYVRQLLRCGLWNSSFDDSAARTAWREGRRSIALELVREAKEICPKEYAEAITQQDAKEQLARLTEAAKE